jgi:hypothetical protein
MISTGAPTRSRTRIAATAALLLLAGGLAACGDDDDTTADGPPSEQATEGGLASPSGDAVDLAAYCEGEVRLEQVASAQDPLADPVAAAEAILAVAEDVRPLAPEEVAPQFDTAMEAMRGVAGGGDPSAFDTVDTTDIHAYDLDNCGWATSDVTMQEFAFVGVEDEYEAGAHSFELTNDGGEAHVLVVVRKAEGVTKTWDEILAEGEESTSYEQVTAGFAPPGATGYAVADLAPGEYLALCPIPEGTTATAEGSGPPHFVHGMRHEFTVS